jgi:hypothetical protein
MKFLKLIKKNENERTEYERNKKENETLIMTLKEDTVEKEKTIEENEKTIKENNEIINKQKNDIKTLEEIIKEKKKQ